MYQPAHFREDRPEVLADFIRRFPLASIVRNGPDGLTADHVPLEHEAVEGGGGRLIGHVAKSNPLWQCAPQESMLVIFQGPSAYISPNWYATKRDTGKVVPTWNYAVVHAHCSLRALHDPGRLRAIVSRLTDRHEAGQVHPWHVDDAPTGYIEAMLSAIVGIELSIHRLEGKWKVSQNHPVENRRSVVAGLESGGSDAGTVMAQLVRAQGSGID